jgi:hypothetical protein
MIVFTQLVILISLGFIVGAGIQALRDRMPIKYYVLESSDGHVYRVAYANRKLAQSAAREMAYSGTAYEINVGNNGKRKLSFIW